MKATRLAAYTLVEILIVVAILALLAAIVVAGAAPLRESARQQHCMSNLHQWGLATAIYRADWDGAEPIPGQPMQCWQLGLPDSDHNEYESFVASYLGGKSLLKDCPDYHSIEPLSSILSTYIWVPANDEMPGPKFSAIVAERGDQTPILTDDNHNAIPPDAATDQPRWETKRILVLRLSGQAQNERVPTRQSYPGW